MLASARRDAMAALILNILLPGLLRLGRSSADQVLAFAGDVDLSVVGWCERNGDGWDAPAKI